MREFRPPERTSKLRFVLGIVILAVGLVPIAGLSSVLLGMSGVSYAIHDGQLVVRSGDLFFGDRTVRLSAIADARAATIHGGRRIAGAALPGYCIGHFWYADLGSVWQATDCSGRDVVVRIAAGDAGGDRTWVLTPPDPDAFVASLRAGDEASVVLPPPDKGPLFLVAGALVPGLLLLSGMTGALIILGPRRMRYRVGGGTLDVKTLYGSKRFALAGSTARAYAPGRLWRLAGAGMPGYFTGIFLEKRQSTRVYATDLQRAVLIEGTARVIVSPANREGFLAALRDEGAEIAEVQT